MSEYCAMCNKRLDGDGSLMTFEALGPKAKEDYTKESYVICRFCALSISAFMEALADLRDSMDEYYNVPVCGTVHLDRDDEDEDEVDE